jgi:hypothetical protein
MQGGLGAMNVGGSMLAGSSLLVNGALGSLAIGGYQAGTIAAASVGTVSLGAGVAGVNGSVLAVNSGGITRTIRAVGVDGASPTGATFKVFYDAASADVPQAAVRVTAANAQQRFDLLLESPADATGIDLSRLDSAGGIRAQVRNVNASGDLLEKISDAQAAFFGDAVGSVGGVYLPLDNLGAVAVGGHMGTSVIKAISIQAVGFSTMQGPQGATWSAAYVAGSNRWWSPLLQSLMTFTKKPFKSGTKMVRPTESLVTPAGTAEGPVGLFVGTASGKKFNRNATFFSDQRIDGQPAVTATVTYGNRLFRGRPIVDTIAFDGDGGSVDTFGKVGSISSNAGVGDVMLRLGRAEVLQGIFAPEIFGTVNLFGGKRLDV